MPKFTVGFNFRDTMDIEVRGKDETIEKFALAYEDKNSSKEQGFNLVGIPPEPCLPSLHLLLFRTSVN
jgi:hypothetical protein